MVACWIIFAVLLLFIPVGFGYFGVLCTKKFNPNEQQKKNMNLSLCKYIFLFWLYDLLFMAIFNQWRALIYVFGLLSIVIIFTNLIGVFLSENKLLNKMISFDLILGIGLSVYLIYILTDEQLKTIVTAVVAALYGGILTLVGVAWTIRHSDKERKEEEKKKAKPIFTFNMVLEEIKDIRKKKVCFDVADNGIEYECHVVAELENSDHALFEVKRVFHDGKWNEIEGNTVVLPNKSVYFDFRFNDDVNNLFLEVKDGLDNSYYSRIKQVRLRGFVVQEKVLLLLRCQSSARYGGSRTACRRVKIVKTVRTTEERAYRKTFGTIMLVSGRKRVETPCIGCGRKKERCVYYL